MSAQYKQKLAVIDAIQYDGSNAQDMVSFGNGKIVNDGGKLMLSHYEGSFPSEIKVTDWAIKGPTTTMSSMPDSLFIVSFEPNV